jgi:subtilisin family serine protease
MKCRLWFLSAVLMAATFFNAAPAAAQNQLIVRTTDLSILKTACILDDCQILGNLDGTINQLFLLDVPAILPIQTVIDVLQIVPGVVDVELNSLLSLSPRVPLQSIPSGLSDTTPISYFGNIVWQGYVVQPASGMIQLPAAQAQFSVSGSVIVADIDTGVDFTHPALQGVLLQGYDFTRNQAGGNEMLDVSSCTTCSSAGLDQSTAAVLDQSTAAVLDQSTAAVLDTPGYSDFGHGTMVMGVIHLVAPSAKLMPLKSFTASGSGTLANILSAIYYAVQNKANVINMSFDFGTTYYSELAQAVAYAQKNGVTCVASAGNEDESAAVYPAALAGVMGVASVSDLEQPSSFSNYGTSDVWVAAPGENIISTYPYNTYASESGTSFTSPMVAGTAALLIQMNAQTTSSEASSAVAQTTPLSSSSMGHGLLNVQKAMSYMKAIMAAEK